MSLPKTGVSQSSDSPVPTAAPNHHCIYTPIPEGHLCHTTVCFVRPFPDPGFPFPLCPLGRLVLESGSSHPGAPSVTSYPSSQLPSASGEHELSGISQVTQMKERPVLGTHSWQIQPSRTCSGEPCEVALYKGLCYQPVIIQINNQPASPSFSILTDSTLGGAQGQVQVQV